MAKARDVLQTPRTLVLMGLVGVVLTYALATRAIDTGSLGQYGLTIVVVIMTVRLFARAIKLVRNDSTH